MAKLSANYEVLYIIDPLWARRRPPLWWPAFKELAEGHGTVTEVDEWGKRKLAYLINDKDEGYYVLMTFTSGPEFPAELDRLMRINTGIMRSIIVCKD